MAKLYFKFGTMGSSKTAQALMTKFNYEEKGYKVLLVKPSVDTRDDTVNESGFIVTKIKSRIGLSADALAISPDDDIRNIPKTYDVIIADEAQFFTREQIIQFREIASFDNIPVMCFGLRTDFQGHLFHGSETLFEVADSISEIKSICKCGGKAIINARLDFNRNVVTSGEIIKLGSDETYEGMCWRCWKEKNGRT